MNKEKENSFCDDSETHRGFKYTKFTDTYDTECSLQISSSVEERIWFGVDDANPKILVSRAKEHGLEPQGKNGWMSYPIPDDVLLTTRMHLSREQVKELLPYLINFVETGEIY